MDDQFVADALQHLHQHQQQDHGDNHHVGLETLVAEANRQIAEATGTDHAGHGGVRDEGNGRHGNGREDTWASLGQQRVHDDLARGGAHGLGRLDDAAIHLTQRGFHQAGEERRGTDHQRRDGTGNTQRGAGDQHREGNHHDQQDDEWQRTQDVHDQRQQGIYALFFEQLPWAAEEQQHTQGQAQQHGEQQRTAKHHQGVERRQPDLAPVHIGEEIQGFH
ncbi:hypothetical protein D3C76_527040 [compost metagenome]